jgi:hypothetical protein
MKSRILASFITALAFITFGLTSPANAIQPVAKKPTYTLVLLQAQPTIKTWSLEDSMPGAIESIFGAKLTTTKGKNAGHLTGSIVSDDILEIGNPGEYRQRNLTFTLPGGQILAKGNSFYPMDQVQLEFDESAVIAVIGGTGKYLGASGEVKTIRKANGTYRHEFTLLK